MLDRAMCIELGEPLWCGCRMMVYWPSGFHDWLDKDGGRTFIHMHEDRPLDLNIPAIQQECGCWQIE